MAPTDSNIPEMSKIDSSIPVDSVSQLTEKIPKLSFTSELSSVTEHETLPLTPWGRESASDLDRIDVSSSMASSLTLNSVTVPLPATSPRLSAGEADKRIRQLKRDIHMAGTNLPNRDRQGLFKTACSTDLLFLIDTTGSMACHINAAKDQIRSIVRDISAAFFNEAEVRIAIVGYKDHTDDPNIQFLDFTTSVETVRSFLSTLFAVGGNDLPEDVLGGLKQALDASWKHKTRCIIHIADAPPHGSVSHDLAAKEDNYLDAGSEPHGLTYGPLLARMIKMNMNYVLLRINSSTDRMAFNFFSQYDEVSTGSKLHSGNTYYNQAVGVSNTYQRGRRPHGSGLLFEEQELGTSYSALRHLVVGSVTSSASRTAVRTLGSTPGPSKGGSKGGSDRKGSLGLAAIDEDEDMKDTALDESVPQWTSTHRFNETLLVEGFSPDVLVHGSRTLKEMMLHNDNIQMNIVELTIHKCSRPFSEGALRIASYARTASSVDRFVVKSFKKDGKHLAHLAEDMRSQALCKAFALEYNSLVANCFHLDFIVTTCLKGSNASDRPGEEFMSLEPYLDGTYTKYNNNSGYVNTGLSSRFNDAAQAFSHFTFERSAGEFLVCDLQGVNRLLTDPAIHAKNTERFKLCDTNLGVDGFKFFFATHVCNHVCRTLQLKSNATMFVDSKFAFRTSWPKSNTTVCCSSKLCGKIVRHSSVRKHPSYKGYSWCFECYAQLDQFKVVLACDGGEAGGEHEHTFETSAFFHESQGRNLPDRCVKHRDEDDDGLVGVSSVVRSETAGASIWGKLRAARRRSSNYFERSVDWLQR